MNQKIKIIILCFSLPVLLCAQKTKTSDITIQPDDITNGAYSKDHNQKKSQAYMYPKIQEKDIVWSRTIWREIDLRQKINHQFYYPSVMEADLNPEYMSLIDVICEALEENSQKVLDDFKNGGDTTRICTECHGDGTISKASVQNPSSKEKIKCSRCDGYKPILDKYGRMIKDTTLRAKQKTCVFQLRCFNSQLQTPGREFSDGWMDPKEVLTLRDDAPTKNPVRVQNQWGVWGPKVDTTFDHTRTLKGVFFRKMPTLKSAFGLHKRARIAFEPIPWSDQGETKIEEKRKPVASTVVVRVFYIKTPDV